MSTIEQLDVQYFKMFTVREQEVQRGNRSYWCTTEGISPQSGHSAMKGTRWICPMLLSEKAAKE